MTAWLIVTTHVHDRAGFMADFGPGAAALVENLGALRDPRAGSAAAGR